MASEPPSGHRPLSRRRILLGAVGGACSALAGCVARGEPSDLEGEIRMDGSNTVLPHGAVISEEFQWRNRDVMIPVQGSGTGAGFQRFARGETDFQNASRRIEPFEEDLAAEHDLEYVELETALDGIVLFTSPENDFLEELTVEELGEIWEPGPSVETWADVRSEWPDEEIDLYGRDPASGTFDYFTREITGDGEQIGNIRSDYAASADTNVIVRGVRGSEYALGFGGYGYYAENRDDLKLIEVDDGDGPVRPGRETIEGGEYTPLTRSLYSYVSLDSLERAEVEAFARFYFEPIDEEGRQADIVDDDEELVWTQWAARRAGYNASQPETVAENEAKLREAIAEVTE